MVGHIDTSAQSNEPILSHVEGALVVHPLDKYMAIEKIPAALAGQSIDTSAQSGIIIRLFSKKLETFLIEEYFISSPAERAKQA